MPAGGIELNDDQLKRLSNLTPASGERHDKANMASIELTASGRTFMLPPLVAPIRRRLRPGFESSTGLDVRPRPDTHQSACTDRDLAQHAGTLRT